MKASREQLLVLGYHATHSIVLFMTEELPKRCSGSLYSKLAGLLSFAGAISEDDGQYSETPITQLRGA